jgi:acyl-CoA thioester hydrolase
MSSADLTLRIYWEDTDAGGIVYYANYLKFAERARTEALRALGIEQQLLKEQYGLAFVVTRAEIDYKRPARLDDLLIVETQLQDLTKLRMTMRQRIRRGDEMLAEVVVKLACIAQASGKPTPFPVFLRDALHSLLLEV